MSFALQTSMVGGFRTLLDSSKSIGQPPFVFTKDFALNEVITPEMLMHSTVLNTAGFNIFFPLTSDLIDFLVDLGVAQPNTYFDVTFASSVFNDYGLYSSDTGNLLWNVGWANNVVKSRITMILPQKTLTVKGIALDTDLLQLYPSPYRIPAKVGCQQPMILSGAKVTRLDDPVMTSTVDTVEAVDQLYLNSALFEIGKDYTLRITGVLTVDILY
jgi:hypothetical protein